MTPAPPRPASTTDPTGEFPLDLTSYVFHLFTVVARHREVRLEAELKRVGLNLSRHRALGVILALEPCTMSELAEYAAVDRTTLTRTVDQLVDAGLVERATPREDRRQVPEQRRHVELHADRHEEEPEQRVAEWPDAGLDLVAILGFRQHHAGEEGAGDRPRAGLEQGRADEDDDDRRRHDDRSERGDGASRTSIAKAQPDREIGDVDAG